MRNAGRHHKQFKFLWQFRSRWSDKYSKKKLGKVYSKTGSKILSFGGFNIAGTLDPASVLTVLQVMKPGYGGLNPSLW